MLQRPREEFYWKETIRCREGMNADQDSGLKRLRDDSGSTAKKKL